MADKKPSCSTSNYQKQKRIKLNDCKIIQYDHFELENIFVEISKEVIDMNFNCIKIGQLHSNSKSVIIDIDNVSLDLLSPKISDLENM